MSCENYESRYWRKYKVDFVVVDQDALAPLLNRKAAEMMNLITVNYDNMT